MRWRLRQSFPKLTDQNHSISSPASDNYNCVAWAYEVSNKKMWPGARDYYWPPDVAGGDTLQALIQLYLDAGYEQCDSGQREDRFKKVAIYVNQEGPQHVARQLESGRWTSKLGDLEDIEHDTLDILEGEDYGKATVFLRKRLV
jgi:hypothetical protein